MIRRFRSGFGVIFSLDFDFFSYMVVVIILGRFGRCEYLVGGYIFRKGFLEWGF